MLGSFRLVVGEPPASTSLVLTLRCMFLFGAVPIVVYCLHGSSPPSACLMELVATYVREHHGRFSIRPVLCVSQSVMFMQRYQ